MPSEKVLLTGASGFIALEILYQLQELGQYQVRGTVRDASNEKKCKPVREVFPNPRYPLELVEADLSSDKGWEEAVKGVTYILHTASPFVMRVKHEDDLIVPAREGTLRVLRAAAKEPSVKRVILTSSCASIGYGHPDHKNERIYGPDDWSVPANVDAYTKSKTLAEKAAWDFVKDNKDHQFELCTINPALVVGEFRGSAGTSLNMMRDIVTGALPFVAPIGIGMVDVKDVGAAHILAMTKGVPGQRYILAADSAWFADIIAVCRAEFEPLGYTKIPSFQPPFWLVKLASFFVADAKSVVLTWGEKPMFDHSKTEQDLGLEFRDWKAAVIAAVHCLIRNGEIPATEGYKAKYPDLVKA
ncbi:putative oxidoreductase [Porphyridium purpureum]|uniref:Putative oxidoreductase n=1 Tax=Porphyridium purpureum TaxID=35688 RepID=A0A5J4Z859_PORPP|nr:putative oxidoreductase [Porphyridium purpureum]|eukprot:POR1130..scf295_1